MSKKILIFAPFFPPHKGGLETHIKEFIENSLKCCDIEFLVFAPFIPNSKDTLIFDKIFQEKNKKVRIIRYEAFELIDYFVIPKFWKKRFWKQLKKLRNYDPDIVETHTRFFFSSLMGLIFSKLLKKPLIHFEHGSNFITIDNKLLNILVLFWDKFFGKLVLKNSSKIVAISKAVENFLIKEMKINKNKIFLSYRGLDFEILNKIKCKKEVKYKFENKIILGYVGRLQNWKGINNTIIAIKNLPRELKEKIVFLVIGDGPEKRNLEKLAGEDLNKTVFFLGQKDFIEAKSIQKCFDIYVHSSYKGGGLSTSLLEAMALGNTIIASPYEGANEVITNNKTGILLKSNDPEEIKKALEYLIKNFELRRKLSENAKKFVEKNFKWEDKVRERLKLIENL